MENFSENTGKRKRGRPVNETLSELHQLMKGPSPYNYTKRAKDNEAYRISVIGFLLDSQIQGITYLLDEKGVDLGLTKSFKGTIISELGRALMEMDDNAVIEMTETICLNRMPTKQAVFFIREMRGVRSKHKDKIIGAARAILTTLDTSMLTETEKEQVINLVTYIRQSGNNPQPDFQA